MMLEENYGTRPDLLPQTMVQVTRASETSKTSNKKIVWIGRPGVTLLNLQEHRQYERESLASYPQHADGTVEWSKVPEGIVIYSSDSDSVDIKPLIETHCSKSSNLFFFWGSLAIPSVKMHMETTLANISSISKKNPEFWMYSPDDRLFLEKTFSGDVTLARVTA